MILSIVSVVYQAEYEIRKTIESVSNQDFDSYEYIIIDGASKDKTYEIVCSFNDDFKRKNIRYLHMSEADEGIFDAMNKSLKYCSGEWIYYLNAGDVLYSNNTLKVVFSKLASENVDIFYGGVVRKKGDKKFYRPPQKLQELEYTMPFSHQATFVKTDIMKRYRFDTTYKLASDYELMVRFYSDKCVFSEIDQIIAIFDLGGVSQTRLTEIAAEFKSIQKKYGFYQKNPLKHFWQTDVRIPLKGNWLVYRLYMILMRIKYGKI